MGKSRLALKDFFTTDVVSVNPQDTVREALNLMVENRVSALPVVDSRQRCVGVISVTDVLEMTKDLSEDLHALSEAGGLDHSALVQKLERADLLTEPVQGWMSADVVVASVHHSVQQAAKQMLQHRVHRLVVVDEDEKLVGVVSTMDLLSAFVEG